MPRGLGVGAVQGDAAPAAEVGLGGEGIVELVGRDEGPGGSSVPGLSAPFFSRWWPGRLAFEVDRLAGGGLRRVAGVGAKAVPERADLILQGKASTWSRIASMSERTSTGKASQIS